MKKNISAYIWFAVLTSFFITNVNSEQQKSQPFYKKIGSRLKRPKTEVDKTAPIPPKSTQNITASGLSSIVNLNTLLHNIAEGKNISGICHAQLKADKVFVEKAGGKLDIILGPCFNKLYSQAVIYFKAKSRLSHIALPLFCKNVSKLENIVIDFYQLKNELINESFPSASAEANKNNMIRKKFLKVKDCYQSIRNSLEKKVPKKKNEDSSQRVHELNDTLSELGIN